VANHFEKPLPTQLRYKTSFGKGGFFLSIIPLSTYSNKIKHRRMV